MPIRQALKQDTDVKSGYRPDVQWRIPPERMVTTDQRRVIIVHQTLVEGC